MAAKLEKLMSRLNYVPAGMGWFTDLKGKRRVEIRSEKKSPVPAPPLPLF